MARVPFSEAPLLTFGDADRRRRRRHPALSSPKLKNRGLLPSKVRTRSSRKPRPQVRCKRWERTSAAATAPVATAPFPSLRLKRCPHRCGWENCADIDSAGGHCAHCTLDDAHSIVSTSCTDWLVPTEYTPLSESDADSHNRPHVGRHRQERKPNQRPNHQPGRSPGIH